MANSGNSDQKSTGGQSSSETSAEHACTQADKALDDNRTDGQSSGESDTSAHDTDPVPDHSQTLTCCPTCQTVFEVSTELLALNDTRVRCGECLSIFDALVNLKRGDHADGDDPSLGEEHGISDVSAISAHEVSVQELPFENDNAAAELEHTDPSDAMDAEVSNAMDEPSLGPNHALTASDEQPEKFDPTVLDATYSDFDLFSGEAELPEVAYFDQTQATDGLEFSGTDVNQTLAEDLADTPGGMLIHDASTDVQTSNATTEHSGAATGTPLEADQLFAAGAPSANVEYLTDDTPSDPLQFNYRETGTGEVESESAVAVLPRRQRSSAATRHNSPEKTASGVWLKRLLLALLIIVIAIALYGYRYRSALVLDPGLRPTLSKICSVVGCDLPPLVDLDALQVVKRTVYSHPTIENALVIDLSFINQASFSQQHPILEIRLTSRNGGLVVQNNFAPSDYLKAWESGDLFAAGERLDLTLTVEDPGQTATSFELKFR